MQAPQQTRNRLASNGRPLAMVVWHGSENDPLKEFVQLIRASRLSCEMHAAAAAAVQFALLLWTGRPAKPTQ